MAAARSGAGQASPATGPVRDDAPDAAIDWAFLAAQTLGDRALERDVLGLFLDQARRVAPQLWTMTARERSDAAHLLKGSCRGIGALAAAAASQAVENAPAIPEPVERLRAALAAVEAAIAARLAAP